MDDEPPMDWSLEWTRGVNRRYEPPEEVRQHIVHSIEGLDPHHPVFRVHQCYRWTHWSTMVIKEDHVFIGTPLTDRRSGWSLNVRALLAFQFFKGKLETPVTSSKKPCVCGSGLTYGACCFPTIAMSCPSHVTQGIVSHACVNPLHFKRVKNKEIDGMEVAVAVEPSPLHVPEECTQCGWKSNKFLACRNFIATDHSPEDKILDLHGSALQSSRIQIQKWKHREVKRTIEELEMIDDSIDLRPAKRVLTRIENKMAEEETLGGLDFSGSENHDVGPNLGLVGPREDDLHPNRHLLRDGDGDADVQL